jgi:hypothetical protein
MTKLFDNYYIERNGRIVQLNYSRTSKDWFDFLILTFFGMGALFVSSFTIIRAIRSEFSWIYTAVIILFGFVGIIKIIELLSRLSEPTKGILTIDKQFNSLIIKKTHFKKEKCLISELNCIEYSLHTDFVRVSNHSPKRRYWIEVQIQVNKDRKIKILNINPEHILDLENEKTKNNLFKIAKPLLNELSLDLAIKSVYKGVIDEEKTDHNN